MNVHLRRTFYLFAAGFVALIGVLAYWQVYARESLANDPHNSLQTRRNVEAPRGLVLAGDNETILAESVPRETESGTAYERVYPEGAVFSNIVGYWSGRYGATGVEIGENSQLSGNADPATVDDLINQFSGGPTPGNNVVLTIDPELQRLAYDQIAASRTGRGSAVVLDPETGEVVALASYPSYDPNNIDQRFPELADDPNDPLLNRATQGLFVPGSTFKVVTAAAALRDGVEPGDDFVDTGSYIARGYRVINFQNEEWGRIDFTRALAYSVNTIFARVAVEIVGAVPLAAAADDFGFGAAYEDFPLPVSQSTLGGGPPRDWPDNYLAAVGFGQGEIQTNVFQMSLVAATVANGGVMMEPRIVEEIRSPEGVVLERTTPAERGRVLEEDVNRELAGMMRAVVTEGGAAGAEIPGARVAAKTGTAEVDPGDPHSWFIAFAERDGRRVAVGVLIENGGRGDFEALPVGRRLMEAYLNDPAR